MMPSVFRFLDLFERGRHLRARLKANDVHFVRAHRKADSEMSTISLRGHSVTFSSGGHEVFDTAPHVA